MMTQPDFQKKQIVFVFLSQGEKISFSNDNLVVRDHENRIKLQTTCYRVFMLCVVGSFTITTGLVQRSHKFCFPVYLMTGAMKVYDKFGAKMEGNVLLRRKQYDYSSLDLARMIVKNKTQNQLAVLQRRRNKSKELTEDIIKIKNQIEKLSGFSGELCELLSIEGNVAKLYFKHEFDCVDWKGRKPRIKSDYVNSILDIGYSMLFNVIDSLLDSFGFDVYCGVLHKEFYMRKSLVCDLMEPFRPIIDTQIRKSINLRQFTENDFIVMNGAYVLNWDFNKKYVSILLEAILKYKIEIFGYIQSYYRCFMKGKSADEFTNFLWSDVT